MKLNEFFSELKDRKVHAVAIDYLKVGGVLGTFASLTISTFHVDLWILKIIIIFIIIGFPITTILAWHYARPIETPRKLRYFRIKKSKIIGVAWLLFFNSYLFGIYYMKENRAVKRAASLIESNRWISYQPYNYDPIADVNNYLDTLRIAEELKAIEKAKFTGIITFGAHPSLNAVYKIAKDPSYDLNLKIICGIWDPDNSEERNNAHKLRDYVDAYSVGQNRLIEVSQSDINEHYLDNTLIPTMDIFKRRTGKPVSTTEKIISYKKYKQLLKISDWLFPYSTYIPSSSFSSTADCNNFLKESIKQTRSGVADMCSLNKRKKAILLKMLLYPVDGINCASCALQADFFREILPDYGFSHDIFPNVSASIDTAFDPIWKLNSNQSTPWDPHTGVFESDGTPRNCIEIIKAKKMLVSNL